MTHRISIHGRRVLCSCGATASSRNGAWLQWWKSEHLATRPQTPPAAQKPVFLTVAQCADTMCVSKMTVYRLMKRGELPSAKFGGTYRVTEAALSDYIRRAFGESA